MKVSYNWLKAYIGEKAPNATDIRDLIGKHSFEIDGFEELDSDAIIDIDITPNRSSDCLCHRGIAREVATITNTKLENDPLSVVPSIKPTDLLAVEIEDTDACPRFTASLITGIKIAESPQWLKDRLLSIGQRPINNIVDATNYVMYALGQPMHAYDAELFPQVDGKWQFSVRRAKDNETISLLAEGEKLEDRIITLTGTELLIVDTSSNTPIGLAGVKGGRFAGVHKDSTKIIVEAAHFDPILTRKTARSHGIVIDASKRFENEPSRELPSYAQAEIISLIEEIAGGTCEGMIDEYLAQKNPPAVRIHTEKVNRILGLTLSTSEIVDIIERTGSKITVHTDDTDSFTATGPFERTDLNIEEDYIEEVGRIYGYEHIFSVAPEQVPLPELNKRHYYSELIRGSLLESGFSEVITSTFVNKDSVQLFNALANDKTCLRSSLTNNLETALDQNVPYKDLLGLSYISLFEIGTVFDKSETGISEHVSLAIGVKHKRDSVSKKDTEVLHSAISALEQKLEVSMSFSEKDGVAELHLTSFLEKLPEPNIYNEISQTTDISYRPISIYPPVSRDIALWVKEGISADDVEKTINENAGPLRVITTLFDEFTKEGRTSFAYRLVFQSNNKTLTDGEVNSMMEKVYEAAAKEGYEVR